MSDPERNVFPVCALTRAQAGKRGGQFDLSETFLSPLLSDTGVISSDIKVKGAKPVSDSVLRIPATREQLIAAQKSDPSLVKLFSAVVAPEKIKEKSVSYFLDDGLLLRKWSPATSSDSEWGTVYQLVLPDVYRHQVMALTQDSPWSGHLGINKTYDRLL